MVLIKGTSRKNRQNIASLCTRSLGKSRTRYKEEDITLWIQRYQSQAVCLFTFMWRPLWIVYQAKRKKILVRSWTSITILKPIGQYEIRRIF